MYILNAFSINMLGSALSIVQFKRVSLLKAIVLSQGAASAVGHESTASIFSWELGRDVPACRATISLVEGDEALVGQYKGPRLPEGATVLPEGATIEWFHVTVLQG